MDLIKAVIFDMDGVLTETSHEHFLAWKELANELGYELPDEVKDAVKGISRLESLEIVLQSVGLQNKYNEREKEVLATHKNNIYLELIGQFTKDNLSSGAVKLLEELKKSGVLIGLASASKNAPFLLKAMEIEEYFDAVVNPAEIANGKPAPDIFLKAAELLEVDSSECIGVEDAYAGVESILSAGMLPIGIGEKNVLSNCENVFSSLEEIDVKKLIDLWNKNKN